MPLVTGFIRPRILLPEHWSCWSSNQLRSVLAHEIAHLNRGDTLFSILSWLLRSLYWFHPISGWISNQISILSEQASDEIAVQWTGCKRTDYARHLIRVARPLAQAPRIQLVGEAAMARNSNVSNRVDQVLAGPSPVRALKRYSAILVVGLLILATTGFALQTEPQTEPQPEPQPEAQLESAAIKSQRPGPQPQPQPQPQPRPFGNQRFGRNWNEREVDYSRSEIAALIRGLTSPDAPSRARAAHRLGNSKTPIRESLEPLLALLGDGTPVEISAGWEDEPYVTSPGREAAFALGELKAMIIELAGRILRSGSEEARTNAARAIGFTELRAAIEPLAEGLNDNSARVRGASAWGMGMIESEAAIQHLSQSIEDSDTEVRAQSAWALGMIESARGVEALGRAVQDPSVEVREQVAWALGMIEDESGVSALEGLVQDTEAAVRRQAVWALGMIEHRSGVALLADALFDESQQVRRQAAWAIGMIEHPSGVAPLLEALFGDDAADAAARKQIAWALGMIESSSAVEGLTPLLEDSNEGVRKQSAWALGMIESSSATPSLVESLFDDSPGVRNQVAWALGMIEDSAGTAALLDAIDDSDDGVRRQVVWALGMIEDWRALERLEATAEEDGSSSVRKQARWAIDMIKN